MSDYFHFNEMRLLDVTFVGVYLFHVIRQAKSDAAFSTGFSQGVSASL